MLMMISSSVTWTKLFFCILALINILHSLDQDFGREQILNWEKEINHTSLKSREVQYLGYVTPWNRKGYEFSLKYAHKFDYISPVWFNMAVRKSGECKLEGWENVKYDWLSDIRSKNELIQIVPRVVLSNENLQNFINAIVNEGSSEKAFTSFFKEANNKLFDGIVFEIPINHLLMNYRNFVMELLVRISSIYKNFNKVFILVLYPPIPQSGPSSFLMQKELDTLLDAGTTAFNVMTYDYTPHGRVGPISPTPWIEKCINRITPEYDRIRQHIIMGVNFYGRQFSPKHDAITVGDFIDFVKLSKNVSISWNEEEQEAYFMIKRSGVFYHLTYPIPEAIKARLDLAEDLGVAVGIWELGQGPEEFLDLL